MIAVHEESWRPFTDWERRLIHKLLLAPFPGRDELLAQLQDAVCTSFTENGDRLANGGLFFKTANPIRARVASGVPTEGEATDVDGVVIHYLLHVYDGTIGGLEVYKEDSSKVQRDADPEELDVLVAMTPNRRVYVRQRS
jgi:hypothetical protein